MFEPSGALLASERNGLRRWPVREEPAAPGELRLGPPEELHVPGKDIAISRDGGVVASGQGWGAFVLHSDHPAQPVRLVPHDAGAVSVSPDGRWVATGSHHRSLVKVWEARTGKLAATLPIESSSSVLFSPDGKWLATNAGRVRLWAVPSWQEGPSFEGSQPAFSPDGKLLAVATGHGTIRLLDPADGREYARLEDPNHFRARFLFFSADGTRLVVPSNDSQSVHLWDLRKIRAGLSELKLDWDAPPYPEAPEASPSPLEVCVMGAELVGRSSLELNNRAWHLVTGPPGQRDPARALRLIQDAVKLQPENATYLNTLGVAQYRNRLFKDAARTLEKSLAGGKGNSDAFDLFFLAMCHSKLGDRVKARDCFDRAVKWAEAHKDLQANHVEELKAFRAEAEELLQQAPSPGPRPR